MLALILNYSQYKLDLLTFCVQTALFTLTDCIIFSKRQYFQRNRAVATIQDSEVVFFFFGDLKVSEGVYILQLRTYTSWIMIISLFQCFKTQYVGEQTCRSTGASEKSIG